MRPKTYGIVFIDFFSLLLVDGKANTSQQRQQQAEYGVSECIPIHMLMTFANESFSVDLTFIQFWCW